MLNGKKSAIHTCVLCSGIGGAYYFNPGYLDDFMCF